MENKKKIKVAMYCRVGNASQITHKEQKDSLRGLAEKNGYKVVEKNGRNPEKDSRAN